MIFEFCICQGQGKELLCVSFAQLLSPLTVGKGNALYIRSIYRFSFPRKISGFSPFFPTGNFFDFFLSFPREKFSIFSFPSLRKIYRLFPFPFKPHSPLSIQNPPCSFNLDLTDFSVSARYSARSERRHFPFSSTPLKAVSILSLRS